MNKYVIRTIKKYIPIFAILFLMASSLFLLDVNLNSGSFVFENTARIIKSFKPIAKCLMYILPLLIVSAFAPFFANSYRYSLKKADFYLQLGKSNKKIRYINNIVLYVGLIAIYTFIFSLFTLILFCKDTSNLALNGTSASFGRTYFLPNYGILYLIYIICLPISAGTYLFSYFLITRSNNLLNSIITFICGYILVIFFVLATFGYVVEIENIVIGNLNLYKQPQGFFYGSFISPFYYISSSLGQYMLIEELRDFSELSDISIASLVINSAIFIFITIISTLAFIKEEESSGEYFGSTKGRGKLQDVLFYIASAFMMLWAGPASQLFAVNPHNFDFFFFLFFPLAFIAFYILNSLKNRNFKITKNDLKVYLPIYSIFFVSFLTVFLIAVIKNYN